MEAVDLALILAFDCSASVTFEEFGLIVGGSAAALRDPEVAAGLIGGPHRASLCALLLWSGPRAQIVSIDWTRLASAADIEHFAQDVEDTPRFGLGDTTAIGAALLACAEQFASLPAPAARQVIDVAGDGRANDGPAPGPVRDRLIETGIVINGLCVLHDEPDLIEHYTREIIGGPGAFALPCPDYAGFAEAMRQKLRREIASIPNRRPARA